MPHFRACYNIAMIRRRAVFLLTLLCFAGPLAVSAATLPTIVPDTCNQAGGCQSICDIATLAQNLLNDGIFVAVFLSAILFAWAGFKMASASSAGDSGGVTEAKHIFWYVTLGLVIILAAWIIVGILMQVLTGTGTWNQLCGS